MSVGTSFTSSAVTCSLSLSRLAGASLERMVRASFTTLSHGLATSFLPRCYAIGVVSMSCSARAALAVERAG